MSFEKVDGGFEFECDLCDKTPEEYRGEDFQDCWRAAKADGWTVRKDLNGYWVRRCPECSVGVVSEVASAEARAHRRRMKRRDD